jgi:hypothetical protein
VTGRGPGAEGHRCPVGDCRVTVGPDRLMCRPHWYSVPRPVRDAVWAAWRTGAGAGTPEHAAAIAAAIRAASNRLGDRA